MAWENVLAKISKGKQFWKDIYSFGEKLSWKMGGWWWLEMRYISLMATDDPQCSDPDSLRAGKRSAAKQPSRRSLVQFEQTIKIGRAEKKGASSNNQKWLQKKVLAQSQKKWRVAASGCKKDQGGHLCKRRKSWANNQNCRAQKKNGQELKQSKMVAGKKGRELKQPKMREVGVNSKFELKIIKKAVGLWND